MKNISNFSALLIVLNLILAATAFYWYNRSTHFDHTKYSQIELLTTDEFDTGEVEEGHLTFALISRPIESKHYEIQYQPTDVEILRSDLGYMITGKARYRDGRVFVVETFVGVNNENISPYTQSYAEVTETTEYE